MNIVETCFSKRTVTIGLVLALAIAGVRSYFNLGRLEDPEFTIRCAQVLTAYPGATAQEVAERVIDPIGSIKTVEDFGGLMVIPNVFLRDIATIRRT